MPDDTDCFTKLRLLKNHQCNVPNCIRPCTAITRGNTKEVYWCNFHLQNEVKEGRIIKRKYNFSLYPIARLLVYLGIVKL